MNNTKNIKKNFLYNLIYQVFLVIVPLVVTPYVSRVLLPDGIGKYSYTYSLSTYFTILGSLGFSFYAQREIAKYQNDLVKQKQIFWEINICRLIPVIISLTFNILFCFTHLYGDYTSLMFAFSINIVALIFDIAFYYQGNEKFSKIVFRNIIIKVLSIISIFIFVKDPSDLLTYVLINTCMVLVSNISLWFTLPKGIFKFKFKELRPLSHLKGTIRLFIPTLATTIYTVLDRTLLGLLINETYIVIENGVEVIKKYADLENGYYDQSEKLVKMALTIITCIGTVMIPRNSSEYAKGNINCIKNNILTSSKLVWLIALPIVFGIIAVSSNVVPWFFGDGYSKCINLLNLLSPLVLIIGFSNIIGLQYLVPSGRDSKFSICLILGSVTNLLLNLVFIPFMWSYGAALATLIAELVVTISMFIIVRKEFRLLDFFNGCYKYIIAALIMCVITYSISMFMSSSILNSFCLVLIGITIYILLLVIFKEEFTVKAINYLKIKIK